jgi:hypothetical protein
LTSGTDEADKRGIDPGTSKPVFGPLLTLQEFKYQLNECLREYFDSCDADEVIRTLEELGCQEFLHEVPKKAISLALDMGPRERELVSRLLTCLHPTPLAMSEMEDGFNALLDGLDELSMDVPEAKVKLSYHHFLWLVTCLVHRCVGILTSSFLHLLLFNVDNGGLVLSSCGCGRGITTRLSLGSKQQSSW